MNRMKIFFVCGVHHKMSKHQLFISSGCKIKTAQNQELMWEVPNGCPKKNKQTNIKSGETIGVKPDSEKTVKKV